MTTLEKAGALIAVVVFAFTVGVGWNALNNRIEQVDSKVASIQEMLGSTACTAILSRQIEAIEKGRVEARQALEGLSAQYDCVPRRDVALTADDDLASANMSLDMSSDDMLANQLEAVDALLNEQD